MNSVYEMYRKLLEICESGCNQQEAERFFKDTAESLKAYVTNHIDAFIKTTADDFDSAMVCGDIEEAEEQLELIGDVLDDFMRNEEEETLKGIPQVVFHFPKRVKDMSSVADAICALYTVILNVAGFDPEDIPGVMYFIGGVAYANGARIIKTAETTYTIVPYHIEVPDSQIMEYIEKHGVAVV
jgi:FtsZ-interacting cell division protein YlmF